MFSRWSSCVRTTLNSSAEGNRSSQRRNNRCSTLKIDSVPQLLNNSDIWERNTAVVSEEFGVLNVGVTHSGDNVCWENHEDFSYKAPSFLLPPSNTHLPIRLTKKIPLWVSSRQFHSGINNRLMRRAKATTVEPNVFIEPNSKDLLMECLITEKEITDSLTLLKIPHDAKGFTQVRLPCHHCGSADGYTLHLNNTTGFYWCVDCHSHGSWEEFKEEMQDKSRKDRRPVNPDKKHTCSHHNLTADAIADKIDSVKKIKEAWSHSKPIFEDKSLKNLELASFGINQKLNFSTMISYGVQSLPNAGGLLFPRFSKYETTGQLEPSGLRVAHKQCGNSASEEIYPRKSFGGIFGYRLIKPDVREVVLCVSEIDAMAVYQETKVVALALPNGAVDLPQEVLPYLEQFEKITLWFPPGANMWTKTKKFAAKLGEERCYKLSPSSNPGSPAECLASGQANLSHTLKKAKPFQHHSIELFSDLRESVLDEILHKEKAAGIPFKRFPKLTEVLKGFRPAELTVLSGPTGAGKTTFLSEYSLDLCEQGVNTLWGSFEIKNESLGVTMLKQFARTNLEQLIKKDLGQVERLADKFERLPMYFMKFRGATKMEQVMEAIDYAIYVYDIQHVVIDNLQYMMGSADYSSGVDKFSQQDRIVEQFRRLANNSNVHVTLVIHPRKELPMTELSAVSLYGGIKASQEANNILIIQQQFHRKYLHVVKNRYGGDLWLGNQGSMQFDKITGCFAIGGSPGEEEKPFSQAFNKGNGTPSAHNYDYVRHQKNSYSSGSGRY